MASLRLLQQHASNRDEARQRFGAKRIEAVFAMAQEQMPIGQRAALVVQIAGADGARKGANGFDALVAMLKYDSSRAPDNRSARVALERPASACAPGLVGPPAEMRG